MYLIKSMLSSSTPSIQSTPSEMLIQPIHYRNALNDLLANGDATGTPPARFVRPVSRSRPPRMFGVLAQNAQIYTLG